MNGSLTPPRRSPPALPVWECVSEDMIHMVLWSSWSYSPCKEIGGKEERGDETTSAMKFNLILTLRSNCTHFCSHSFINRSTQQILCTYCVHWRLNGEQTRQSPCPQGAYNLVVFIPLVSICLFQQNPEQ